MFDLVKEVLNHPLCKIDVGVLDQSEDDEVAVPALHFIKAAAWNHIFVRQKQESGAGKLSRFHFAQPLDAPWQSFDLHVARRSKRGNFGWLRHVRLQIED